MVHLGDEHKTTLDDVASERRLFEITANFATNTNSAADTQLSIKSTTECLSDT